MSGYAQKIIRKHARIARPQRNQIEIESMELEKHGDHLVFKCNLMDGGVLNLPIGPEEARGLGQALLHATGGIIERVGN